MIEVSTSQYMTQIVKCLDNTCPDSTQRRMDVPARAQNPESEWDVVLTFKRGRDPEMEWYLVVTSKRSCGRPSVLVFI